MTLYPELTPEREIAEFERLKLKLVDLWNSISQDEDEQAYTSVVIPSFSLDQAELQKVEGISFYEERLLFTLIRLRNPRARLVYVTSQPIHPLIIEYFFQLLAGIPASHAQSRLTLLCTYDSSPKSLTEKILERPRLIDRIRAGIYDPDRAYMTVFNSTPLERRLAVLLGIPLYGADPMLVHFGTKSGSRKVFKEAGVPHPQGFEEIYNLRDAAEALLELKQRNPGLKRGLLKLNDSFSGEGNAILRYPASDSLQAIEGAMSQLEFALPDESQERYFSKLGRMGGVVEEFIEGEEKRSPSGQVRISPTGKVQLISSHDQILIGVGGQVYSGCLFPAANPYRTMAQEQALRIGEVLAKKGAIGRLSVDFVARRQTEGAPWEVFAVEVNLRKGGTTHPFLALQFLTGGSLDPETGLFYTPAGHQKFYRATDNLVSPRYRGLLPEDVIEILTANEVHYSPSSETGVLFYMFGAISQFGKIGMTAIGNSRAEAEDIYTHTMGILDRESVYKRRFGISAPPPKEPESRTEGMIGGD